MNDKTFRLIDAIGRCGIDNCQWGVIDGCEDTRAEFGTKRVHRLEGKWLYVYADPEGKNAVTEWSPNVQPDEVSALTEEFEEHTFIAFYKLEESSKYCKTMAEKIANETNETVVLKFPNIEKEFSFSYPHRMNINRVEQAMRTFYEQEAPLYFALYGYGPMDVSVLLDDREVASYKACYQESMWHSFFSEGGDPWHGRFCYFELSLMECRERNDEFEQRETSKAA